MKLRYILLILILIFTVVFLTSCQNKEVSIKFDTGDQEIVVNPIVGKPGETVIQPRNPNRIGHRFLYWSFNGEKYEFSVLPKKSITLVAVWEAPHYITFETDEEIKPIRLYKGESLDNLIPTLDTKIDEDGKGYRFLYWELEGKEFTLTEMPDRDITLRPAWKQGLVLRYDLGDDNQELNPDVYFEGETLALKIPRSKVNEQGVSFRFEGWLLNDEEFTLTKMPSHDITISAKWEDNIAIHFNTGQSTVEVPSLYAEPGDKIEAPLVNPTLDNHLFAGWFKDGFPYIFDKMPNQTIDLVAHFQETTSEYHSISTLPKMYINLENNFPLSYVDREIYRNAQITLQSNNPLEPIISKSAEFRGRGHGSWEESKKGYRIKFYNKTEMMGSPSSRHWVLLAGANFNDETLHKNVTAFNMARDVMSHIEYTTSTHWVELYVNREYRGVYMVMEHVRVAKERVNIESKHGIIDTGYLIELDAYAREDGPEGIYWFTIPGVKHPFAVKSPDPDDYLDEGVTEAEFREQVNFIKNYTKQVFNAALGKDLNAFRQLADINSFIDMYLLHEIFKNTDTGWSSFYMYKKPGGKLFAGPAWDFDATAGSSRGETSPTGWYVSDTVRQHSDYTASELFISLMEIPEFRQMTRSRWLEISEPSRVFLNNLISDEKLEENQFAFGRNFQFWAHDESYGGSKDLLVRQQKWIDDTKKLRTWLLTRFDWLDEESNW